MCHTLPRIGYKIPYNKNTNKKHYYETSRPSNSKKTNRWFCWLCWFIYGQNDPLYPLVYQGQPLTKTDILQATIVYLEQCENDDFEQCAWGDGDSLDRERVRDILLDKFNYDHKGGTW